MGYAKTRDPSACLSQPAQPDHKRVDGQLERARDWMQREHAAVTAVILLVVGVLLAYTGIRAL